MYYIDTSVLVTALDRDDLNYDVVIDFLSNSLYKKVISPLVLAELMSVLSRKRETIHFHKDVKRLIWDAYDTKKELVIVFYLLHKFNLVLLSESKNKFTLFGTMPALFATAVSFAPDIKLKALDLLHISQAHVYQKDGYPIDYFVTLDAEFAKYTKQIYNVTGIEIHMLE